MAPVLLKLKEKEMRPTFEHNIAWYGGTQTGYDQKIQRSFICSYMGGSVEPFKYQQETTCENTRGRGKSGSGVN